jgi:hypothetical protein
MAAHPRQIVKPSKIVTALAQLPARLFRNSNVSRICFVFMFVFMRPPREPPRVNPADRIADLDCGLHNILSVSQTKDWFAL